MDERLADVMRPVLWCEPDEPVRAVAARIGTAGESCALVRDDGGLGIVTDHDFRQRVATGEIGVDAPVKDLTSAPVLTIPADAPQSTALSRMVEHGVHHLVVTDAEGQPAGVIRAVDLARPEVRDPLRIRSAIEAATTVEALAAAAAGLPDTLRALRGHGVPAARVGLVHAAIVDALLRRALALTDAPGLATVRRSWILLGSVARREPLPCSDLDTALLWEDIAPDPAEAVREHAGRVLAVLSRCGLRPCPNGANADNPLFSRSQSAWHAATRAWAHDPTREGALLLSAMVTDSRPVTELELGHHLTDAMRSHTRTSQFLRALLDEALAWRPARGVVRDFVVPWRGDHRGQLDLKRSGLAPVVALGRWIAIVTADASGTTPDRLRRGAEAGLLTADERDTLVVGFDSVYTLLLDRELDAIRDGRPATTFVRPRELGSLAQRHLRETFRAVDAVQTKVDNAWLRRLSPHTR